MKLKLFNEAAKAVRLPPGNYVFKSKKTGNLFWFMTSLQYDMTVREVHRPGSNGYEEFEFYYHFWLPINRKWHKKIINHIRRNK